MTFELGLVGYPGFYQAEGTSEAQSGIHGVLGNDLSLGCVWSQSGCVRSGGCEG